MIINSQSYYTRNPLNTDNARNIHNTPKRHYNCAGYALGTFSWYIPRTRDVFNSFNFETKAEMKRKTQVSVKNMLKDFPDLRVIHSLDEVQDDEYAILFRHSSDGDFHFMKRGKNGAWYHKMGGLSRIHTESNPFSEVWECRYDGDIVMFAKKLV